MPGAAARAGSSRQQDTCVVGRPHPDRRVAFGETGIGTAGWIAKCDELRHAIGSGHALEAWDGRWINDATRQDADVQYAGEVCGGLARDGAASVGDRCR